MRPYILILILILAACGGDDDATELPTNTLLPRFQQAATATEPAIIVTVVAATPTAETEGVSLNPTAIARGLNSWERLECASCHGENGEGGAGSIGDTEAPSLIGLELSEDEFIDWLRTGGDLGSDHLFSTDRLSDNGSRNLYQYVLSLGQNG
jgi:mono/diheme cytochrome c family protein